MTPYTIRCRVDLADLFWRTVALNTGLDIARFIFGCILVRVMTRHAAELVITLNKALALREAVRLKTIGCLLRQLVEFAHRRRRTVALSTRVINDLTTLICELVQ